ncbi:aspartate kinase [Blastococcus sp. KM273128]|nr:aspartate kinase [Blastococcus sp. KM273128]
MVVCKYGGTSLGTDQRLAGVSDVLAARHAAEGPLVVVVSARGEVTDLLLAQAVRAGGERTQRETDQLLATGECSSAALLAMSLRARGVVATSLTGWQAGIHATGKHGEGVITSIDPRRIRSLLAAGSSVVVAGFQGIDEEGDVLTLGRGGSDTTAVALAVALEARRCEIYTDVDGVYTADPRLVPGARSLEVVDLTVMTEMAFAGARVVHSRAVELAAMHGIDVEVRRSLDPRPGTLLTELAGADVLESSGVVVGVTHDADVARVLLEATGGRSDLAADVLGILGANSVPVDLVARSGPQETEFRMGFTMRRSDVPEVEVALRDHLDGIGGRIRIDQHVGKLSLVGRGLLNRPEYTARLLRRLAAAQMWTSWVSTSQLRTSVVIPLDRLDEAVALVHAEFGLDESELPAHVMALL